MFIKGTEVTDIGTALIVKYPSGQAFKVDKFKGKFAAKMLAKFIKYGAGIFGGIITAMVGKEEGNESIEDSAIDMLLAGSMQGAFASLDDPDFLDFFYSLFITTSLNGQALDFDEAFSDNLEISFDLAARIAKYNYSSVFQNLGISALLKTKAQDE